MASNVWDSLKSLLSCTDQIQELQQSLHNSSGTNDGPFSNFASVANFLQGRLTDWLCHAGWQPA